MPSSLQGRPEGLHYMPLLLPLVKRHRHDARAGAASADVDVELGVECGVLDWQIRHTDGALHVRRLGPAGDDAHFGIADVDIVPVAPDTAVEHFETDDLTAGACRLLLPQRRCA